jgi:hypothetical protein
MSISCKVIVDIHCTMNIPFISESHSTQNIPRCLYIKNSPQPWSRLFRAISVQSFLLRTARSRLGSAKCSSFMSGSRLGNGGFQNHAAGFGKGKDMLRSTLSNCCRNYACLNTDRLKFARKRTNWIKPRPMLRQRLTFSAR